MRVMTYKNGFEPKDARTIHSYDQDDDFDDFDDWSLESIPPRPRRQRKTGTQALVEFLNTTSPEEFQKVPPAHPPTTSSTKRRSTRFFLRRLHKNKSSSSSTSSTPSSTSGGSSLASLYQQAVPHTIHRKNYIEIVTSHPTRIPHYYDPLTHGGSGSAGTSPFQPLASASKISLNEPILPNRRESSLHAPSIRSLSIHKSSPYPTTSSPTPATRPQLSSSGVTANTACISPTTPATLAATALKSPKMKNTLIKADGNNIKNSGADDNSDNNNDNNTSEDVLATTAAAVDEFDDDKDDKKRKMVDALVASCGDVDAIEAGLIQRLKQCQLYGLDKPMDVVTARLTEEHIRALKVSAAVSATAMVDENEGKDPSVKRKKKGRARHAQVQTMAPSDDHTLRTSTVVDTTTMPPPPPPSSSSSLATNYSVEDLQRQLDQERQERQRLEAALETTCDHFEVLSGLAYKKLRELWEEKLRWENACVDLNDKLSMIEQNNSTNSSNNNNNMNDAWTEDYQHSDYIVG